MNARNKIDAQKLIYFLLFTPSQKISMAMTNVTWVFPSVTKVTQCFL